MPPKAAGLLLLTSLSLGFPSVLGAHDAVLRGRLVCSGSPWRSAVISVLSANVTVARAHVNADGEFSLALRQSGRVAVVLRDDRSPLEWHEDIELQDGDNVVDFLRDVEVLDLTIVGASGPVTVAIATGGRVVKVDAESAGPLYRLQLPVPPGQYSLNASDSTGRASLHESVKVAAMNETHSLALTLAGSPGTLTVFDSSGSPIDAQVIADGQFARRIGPGAFSLAGFADDSVALIRYRPLAPQCIAMSTAGDHHVVMSAGRRFEIAIRRGIDHTVADLTVQSAPEGCSLSIAEFGLVRLASDTRGYDRWAVALFPRETCLLIAGKKRYSVTPETTSVTID